MKRFWRVLTAGTNAMRIILRFILVAAGLFLVIAIILGLVVHFHGPWSTPDPPNITEAPWIVQTSSRLYYAKELMLDGTTPEIKDYWTFDGKNYDYHQDVLVFAPNLYGKVDVIRRTK